MKPVAWFDSPTPLRSGWAWGQQYLDQAVAIVEAPVGKGRVVLFGPEIVWRAQPHGTFKLLFNGIYYAKRQCQRDRRVQARQGTVYYFGLSRLLSRLSCRLMSAHADHDRRRCSGPDRQPAERRPERRAAARWKKCRR